MPQTQKARRWAPPSTAAEYLQVSPKTLRRMIAAGEVSAYRLRSRAIRLDLDELDQLLRPIPTAGGDAA